MIQSIVAEINTQTGESECRFYKERLLYLEDSQRDLLIDHSRILSCHGELKNNRGAKLHVFLFQDVLVITRAITHNEQLHYQLYRQPIPVRKLQWEDLQDGVIRLGGSIRGAFSNNERTKNFFRVSFHCSGQLHSHSFQASDAFNKQQWLNCIRQAKGAAESAMGVVGTSSSDPEPPPSPLSPQGLLSPATPPLSGPLAPQPKSMDHCDSDSSVDSLGCSMDMDTSVAQMDQTHSSSSRPSEV
ncbi:unnamed protein product [Coregonus sp. 'balchen']|nr:unnamed protein product [Coregonus sp. 'balchen']